MAAPPLAEPRPLARRGPRSAERMTHLTVRIPRRIVRAAKAAAIVADVRLQAFVTAAIEEHLERSDA